jgi:NitT/TauT family transport system permease protein
MAVMAFSLLVGAWEGYKAIGNPDGVSIDGLRVLPRADDDSMPHVWQMFTRALQPEVATAAGQSVAQAVGSAMWFSARVAFAGLLIGAVLGVVLAVVMHYSRLLEDALLPYVVLSQTVPLVALAPLIVGWGGHVLIFGQPWQPWMSVAAISAYLAFFPVSVGMLRGLHSPTAIQVEVLRAGRASRWQTLTLLRLPASVPFVIPALRLAAAAAVIGAIVAEISTGTRGGIGRLVIEYAQASSGDPAKPYCAMIGAALLGLVTAGGVRLIELALHRYRGSGES